MTSGDTIQVYEKLNPHDTTIPTYPTHNNQFQERVQDSLFSLIPATSLKEDCLLPLPAAHNLLQIAKLGFSLLPFLVPYLDRIRTIIYCRSRCLFLDPKMLT